MKTWIMLGLFAMGVSASAQNSQSWVRQTDLTNGIVYDVPLGAYGGDFEAPLPISEMGSSFQLYARGTAWDTKIYLLDTKLIRTYSPNVTVTVNSEDSYSRGDPNSTNYVRRTRADRPFSLNINVSGLAPNSGSQAERQVYFSVNTTPYDGSTYSSANQSETLLSETNLGNCTLSTGPLYQQINTTTPTAACGQHTYTFVRYASDGVPDTTLVQSKVEIWPVTQASLEGLASMQVFTDRIPTLTLRLRDLYPDSRTYAQVYQGPAVLGTAGTPIGGTERRLGQYYSPQSQPTNVPQNFDVPIEDLSNYLPKDGIYTVEVITETPFFGRAPERLLAITFEVDRVISSRGQLGTAER
jgi:hypothetical protein